MAVGTRGTVKGIAPDQLASVGVQVMMCNTYHLLLRPGAETVRALGGLHRFTGWDGPIATDSGGFQVYSLADSARVEEGGVFFRSGVDGRELFLGPAESIRAQELLGGDLVMVFDECPSYPMDEKGARDSMERSLRWARACRGLHGASGQLLFGIVQGGTHRQLRLECAERLRELDFPAYAVGGLAVGESRELRREVLAYTVPALPENRPRYLMGVGMPGDLLDAIACGVDLFDCVLPTRNGRNGTAFTEEGRMILHNAVFARDERPIEPGCDCPACGRFSRGYLRHLLREGELLGLTLVSLHNLRFYNRFLERCRLAIGEGRFEAFRRSCPDY
jgi:queuine tRNA-ribosyltransferase